MFIRGCTQNYHDQNPQPPSTCAQQDGGHEVANGSHPVSHEQEEVLCDIAHVQRERKPAANDVDACANFPGTVSARFFTVFDL